MTTSPDINTYVITQLQAGLTPEDITVQLTAAGWTNDAIQATFAAASQQLHATTIAATAPQPDSTAQLPPPIKRGRMKTGWLLFKQSLAVIKHNPALVRYMVMSMLLSLALVAIMMTIFIVDFLNGQTLISAGIDTDGRSDFFPTLAGIGVGVIFGFVGTVIAYYYATALSSHVLGIFRGTPGTYAQHISVARAKLPAIIAYAAIATAVGYLLRLLEERFRWVGWIISKILGALWTLATSFVLPIIADSDDNGPAAIKRSVALFKTTWGETIASRVSLTGLVILLYLLIATPLAFILSFVMMPILGVIGALIVIALYIIGIVILSVLGALAENILNACLYYYAQYGAIPPAYSPELLASVFIDKKKKKSKA